jgi:recombination protein RecT
MSNEVTRPGAKPVTIREQISDEYFKQQIAVALPKHMTADRFVRVALTALLKTPKLLDCTKESVIECMLNCSALGLEPDGRRAHLIPYGNKCTLIVDYKGIVELAKRSGDVAGVFAQTVCDKDDFSWENGEVTHRIDWRQDRGAVYAVYATITFKDGSKQTDVMTRSEVEAIRQRSRAGSAGPWVTDWNEMAKKTVFRRASKWITLSPEVADALEKDGDNFSSLAADTTLTQNKPDFSPAVTSEPAPTQEAPRRGRPPGSRNAPLPAVTPIQATVEPQPEPEPAAKEAAPPLPEPKAAQPAAINYLKGVRGLLALESITEAELLAFGRDQKGWDDSLGSLEEIAMAQPSKLEQVYNEWGAIVKNLKAARV